MDQRLFKHFYFYVLQFRKSTSETAEIPKIDFSQQTSSVGASLVEIRFVAGPEFLEFLKSFSTLGNRIKCVSASAC